MIAIREFVERAITRFEGAADITVEQLADIVGFSDQEKAFARTSWALVYTSEWVYLSDKIILDHLTAGRSKDAIALFIKRELIAKFIYEHDYVQTAPDGVMLGSDGNPARFPDINFSSTNLSTGPHVNGKRYFIVSPDCMKRLFLAASTKRGSETRDYFIKLEKLAVVMREYIIRANQLLHERAIAQLDQARTLAIEDARTSSERAASAIRAQEEAQRKQEEAYEAHTLLKGKFIQMREMARSFQTPIAREFIYIMTSPSMALQNHFKIGRTDNLVKRLSNYNSGRPSTDAMFIVRRWKCYRAADIEIVIKHTLEVFADRKAKEIVIMPFDMLARIVEILVNDDRKIGAILIDFHDHIDERVFATPIIPPAIDPSIDDIIELCPNEMPVAEAASSSRDALRVLDTVAPMNPTMHPAPSASPVPSVAPLAPQMFPVPSAASPAPQMFPVPSAASPAPSTVPSAPSAAPLALAAAASSSRVNDGPIAEDKARATLEQIMLLVKKVVQVMSTPSTETTTISRRNCGGLAPAAPAIIEFAKSSATIKDLVREIRENSAIIRALHLEKKKHPASFLRPLVAIDGYELIIYREQKGTQQFYSIRALDDQQRPK